MKIYTKTGDAGTTGLFGGKRVSKSSQRVEAYGAVDELNASLGWALSQLPGSLARDELREIQEDLFAVGAELALQPDAPKSAVNQSVKLDPDRISQLESHIDRWNAETPPLRLFILPGGCPGAASLHVARTVCRRAERAVVALAAEEAVESVTLVYLNRLSDLLFVLARWVNFQSGVEEATWSGKAGRRSIG